MEVLERNSCIFPLPAPFGEMGRCGEEGGVGGLRGRMGVAVVGVGGVNVGWDGGA